MKRTRAQYEEGNIKSPSERLVVNQAALCALIHFYDSDETVQDCQGVTNAGVFDGHYDYYIGVQRGDKLPERPSLYNTPHFLHSLRHEHARARAYIHAIGGVALWAVKDIARWLQQYANAPNDIARSELGLPYGVLEAWEYTLEIEQQNVGRRHIFRVIPHENGRRRDCVYVFYNHNMTLLPLDERNLSVYEKRAGPYLRIAEEMGGVGASSYRNLAPGQQRIPQSPFYRLADLAEELARIKTNLLDADWLAAHPKPLFRAAVSTPQPLEDVDDDALYAARTAYDATMVLKDKQRYMSVQQVADMIAAVRASEGMNSKHDTPRQQQRRYYRYPDMLDDATIMLDTAELMHWEKPVVLNDYTERLREYKLGVLTAMGLSETSRFAQALLGKVAREATGLGGRSHIAMLVDRDERNALTESEQRIHSRIFRVAYDLCGFREHDALTVSALIEALDERIEEEELRRAAAKALAQFRSLPAAPARAADHMLRVETEANEDDRAKSDKEADEILYNLRVKVNDMRAWLAQTARQEESVELLFVSRENDLIKLQFYQEMAATGRVSVKELERQARKVYDQDVHLQEPPEPDNAKGGGGGQK